MLGFFFGGKHHLFLRHIIVLKILSHSFWGIWSPFEFDSHGICCFYEREGCLFHLPYHLPAYTKLPPEYSVWLIMMRGFLFLFQLCFPYADANCFVCIHRTAGGARQDSARIKEAGPWNPQCTQPPFVFPMTETPLSSTCQPVQSLCCSGSEAGEAVFCCKNPQSSVIRRKAEWLWTCLACFRKWH